MTYDGAFLTYHGLSTLGVPYQEELTYTNICEIIEVHEVELAATTLKTNAKSRRTVRAAWVKKLQRMFCRMKGFSVPSKLKLTKAAANSTGTNGWDSITDDAARAASFDKNRKRNSAKQAGSIQSQEEEGQDGKLMPLKGDEKGDEKGEKGGIW